MSRQDLLDELDAVWAEEPSPLAFRALASLIDTWSGPAAERAEVLAEVAERLRGWDDKHRQAPFSWAIAQLEGHEVPSFSLARSVALRDRGVPDSRPLDIEALGGRLDGAAITHLDVPEWWEWDRPRMAPPREEWPRLRSLSLANQFFKSDAFPHLVDSLPLGLEELDLGRTLVRSLEETRTLGCLAESGKLAELKSLTLRVGVDGEGLAAVLDAAPKLRTLRLLDYDMTPEDALHIGRSKGFQRIRDLALVGHPADAHLTNLLCQPGTPHLERLRIVSNDSNHKGFGAPFLLALAQCGQLARLEELVLAAGKLGDEDFGLLLCALGGAPLRRLELYSSGIGDDSVAMLATAPFFSRLEILSLRDEDLTSRAIRLLRGALPSSRLQGLDLSRSFPRTSVSVLADLAEVLPTSLRKLYLAGLDAGAAGLEALAASTVCSQLRLLDLSSNVLNIKAVKALTRCDLSELRELHLDDSQLGDREIRALARAFPAPRLRSLSLGSNAFSEKGIQALAKCSSLATLWNLDLHDTFVGDAALPALARSKHLRRLVGLRLDLNTHVCHTSFPAGLDAKAREEFTNAKYEHREKDAAAHALAKSTALTRLDAFRGGSYDHYDGSSRSLAFSKEQVSALEDGNLRPAVWAALGYHAQTLGWEGEEEDEGSRPVSTKRLMKAIHKVLESRETSLNLFGKGIKELPPEIFQLTHLESLELSYNQLETLPPEIGALTALKELRLGHNRLKSLPPEIGALTELTRLEVDWNQLEGLPKEIAGLTSLQELRAGINQLSRVPSSICKLRALTRLSLWGNRLRKIPASVGKLRRLEALLLERNLLEAVPPSVGKLAHLKALELGGNRLTDLPLELARLPALERFSLWGNRFEGHLADASRHRGVAQKFLRLRAENPEAVRRQHVFLAGAPRPASPALPTRLGAEDLGWPEPAHGVRLYSLYFTVPDTEVALRLKLWDCGGLTCEEALPVLRALQQPGIVVVLADDPRPWTEAISGIPGGEFSVVTHSGDDDALKTQILRLTLGS
jgi:Leucine-rich repeat (LRR) protein